MSICTPIFTPKERFVTDSNQFANRKTGLFSINEGFLIRSSNPFGPLCLEGFTVGKTLMNGNGFTFMNGDIYQFN